MSTLAYKTYFVTQSAHNLISPFIAIRATGSPGWNDFHYNFQAIIEIDPGDGRERFIAPAYVLPPDAENNKRLGGWIQKLSEPVPYIFADGPSFVSLFDGSNFYKKLSQWTLSLEERYVILDLINDIVFLQNIEKFNANKIREIKLSGAFMYGVLRSSSTYRALRRGWRSIQAQEVEALADARLPFRFSTQLDGFEEAVHDLHIHYFESEVFTDRIHALIGVNGTGKTRMLRELALTIANRLPRKEQESVFISDDATEAISPPIFEGPPFNRVMVFSTSSENRFPLRARDDSAFEYQYFNLLSFSDPGQDPNGRQSSLTGVLVDVMRDIDVFLAKDDRAKTRFDILVESSLGHVDLNYLFVPIIDGKNVAGSFSDASGKRWVKALDLVKFSEQRRLEATALVDESAELGFFKIEEDERIRQLLLSSGQNLFFTFALRLISSIDRGTLILIDEPETHLHPNLISDFMSLLYDILDATSSVSLIATHSTYVVRELPTHCVHVCSFDHENARRVSIGKVRLKTLGANIHSISEAVFGDATVKKYHEKIAADIAKGESDLSAIVEKYAAFMSPELLIKIRSAMMQRSGEV